MKRAAELLVETPSSAYSSICHTAARSPVSLQLTESSPDFVDDGPFAVRTESKEVNEANRSIQSEMDLTERFPADEQMTGEADGIRNKTKRKVAWDCARSTSMQGTRHPLCVPILLLMIWLGCTSVFYTINWCK